MGNVGNMRDTENTGLPKSTIKTIYDILIGFPAVKKVVLYGSRAMGNYRRGSDIDLTLYGDALLSSDLYRISGALDESRIPYMVDLSIFEDLTHAKLRTHIKTEGIVFYEREAALGWKTVKLGDVCEFTRGAFGGSLKKSIFVDEGYAVYEQKHAIYNRFDNVRYFITEEKFKEMKRFELKPNDLVMSCSGTLGKVSIVPNGIKRGIINQALLKLTPNDTVVREYLKYYLTSSLFQEYLENISGGAAIKNVPSVKILKKSNISLPPLTVQRKIVEKLDAAFAEIDTAMRATQKNIANAQALISSFSQATFNSLANTFQTVSLGDLCEILDTRRKPITKKDRTHGEYPYYGATGIVDWVADYIFDEELVLIGEDGAKWEAGEKTAFIVDGKYWVNNHAHVVKPNTEKLLNKWLTYYLCGIDLKPWVTGMTVPKLNQGQLKSIPIPLPPLGKQTKVVTKLDKISRETEKMKEKYYLRTENLIALKSSILNQAFTGELTKAAA